MIRLSSSRCLGSEGNKCRGGQGRSWSTKVPCLFRTHASMTLSAMPLSSSYSREGRDTSLFWTKRRIHRVKVSSSSSSHCSALPNRATRRGPGNSASPWTEGGGRSMSFRGCGSCCCHRSCRGMLRSECIGLPGLSVHMGVPVLLVILSFSFLSVLLRSPLLRHSCATAFPLLLLRGDAREGVSRVCAGVCVLFSSTRFSFFIGSRL